jgi:protein TonB
MTAAALAEIGTSSHNPHGWVTSMLVHVLAVSVSLFLFAELRPAPQPEPFRWEIALAQVAPPVPQVEPPPTPPQPKPAVQPPPPAPKPVETKPVVQRVQAVQTIQRMEPVVRQEQVAVKEINPVIESIAQHAEPVRQERQAEHITEAVQRAEAKEVPVAAVTAPAAIAQPNPVSQPEPTAVVSEVATSQEPVTTTEPLVAEAPVQNEPSVLKHSAPQSIQATAPVEQTAPVATQQFPVERSAMVTAKTKADYSWLTQELLSRLERSKRYPYAARMNRWEGRVVVQAVVRDDGQVVSLRIAESSGHAILDNDAIELIRKISPLHLKHPLGQAQVALLVPVGYSLQ